MPAKSFPNSTSEQGFTLLAVLFLVAALGVGLAALGIAWQTMAKREKEAQLLFVGDQYRHALESYYRNSPGAAKAYPPRLEDLLLDRRFPQTVRHLRRLYADPVTGQGEWGLVKEGERIKGVHSLSQNLPLKQAGFAKVYESFSGAAAYSDWQFVAQAEAPAEQPAGAAKTAARPNEQN